VHEVVERVDRLLEVGLELRTVHLVQVDPVRPQAPQAVLDGEHDPAARAATLVGVGPHRSRELRREDDAVAPCGDRPADDRLGLAVGRVGVRRLDEVDARIERGVDDPRTVRVIGIRPGTEVHPTETQ